MGTARLISTRMYVLVVYEKIKGLLCLSKLASSACLGHNVVITLLQIGKTYLRQISRLSSGNFSHPEDRFHRRIFALETDVIEIGDQA